MRGALIHITGIVQGVGMRPFVYREAMAHAVTGWVLNAGDGVHVEAWAADEDHLLAFVDALSAEAPAASRVENVAVTPLEAPVGAGGSAKGQRPSSEHPFTRFEIVPSEDEAAHTTLVSPDIATCPDCTRELFDPADRRFHYPFINCTNCGPRFTIIRDLPYDRPKTSMEAFPMCPTCAAEYADPLDRRFHAQPDACFECGPHITWSERAVAEAGTELRATPAVGRTRTESDAIIERCVELLTAGGIVAIKGLGGFHLACDAGNDAAVRELRRRKRRSNKALAVMLPAIDAVEELCEVDDAERALLTGSVRPIVLLRRKRLGETRSQAAGSQAALSPAVAFDLPELGVMLPYTPLQHLLLAEAARRGIGALVMTSGNLSEEPIETDDALAWKHLVESGIADALLGNDRAILSRYDDSVVRMVASEPMPVRRARGYAPMPLELAKPVERDLGTSGMQAAAPATILACGPEQKAAIALTRERADGTAQCFLSQHIGDVENGETFRAWNEARTRMEELFDLSPAALACDLHPSYLPSQWARERARETGMPLVEIQHHHAHIASVIAEAETAGTHPVGKPVVGIALDGTGAGTDGTVWGGEILVADLAGYERAAHLVPWHLPGGAASVRDARRNAFSLLKTHNLLEHPGAASLMASMDEQTRSITSTMIDRNLNSPLTSSMGRLLDAFAALLGICRQATYEGEPAILLEAAAWRAEEQPADARYRLEIRQVGAAAPDARTRDAMARAGERAGELQLALDPQPLILAALDDLAAGVGTDAIARRVHEGVAAGVAGTAIQVAGHADLHSIALSGGVFMNRLMLSRVRELLEEQGLTVLVPHSVPVNDGCIAYGQAAVARTRFLQG